MRVVCKGRIKAGKNTDDRRNLFDQPPENTPDQAKPDDDSDNHIQRIHSTPKKNLVMYQALNLAKRIGGVKVFLSVARLRKSRFAFDI